MKVKFENFGAFENIEGRRNFQQILATSKAMPKKLPKPIKI
jgi:hypothetical protein